jgi:hypothetical protein
MVFHGATLCGSPKLHAWKNCHLLMNVYWVPNDPGCEEIENATTDIPSPFHILTISDLTTDSWRISKIAFRYIASVAFPAVLQLKTRNGLEACNMVRLIYLKKGRGPTSEPARSSQIFRKSSSSPLCGSVKQFLKFKQKKNLICWNVSTSTFKIYGQQSVKEALSREWDIR